MYTLTFIPHDGARRPLAAALQWLAAGLLLLAGAAGAEGTAVVEPGREVAMEFTVRLEDGSVAQSNVGGEPIVFTVGAGDMLPALEEAVLGQAVGEQRSFTLARDDAYGEVDPAQIVEVDAGTIPEQSRQVGAVMMATDVRGVKRPVRVTAVKPGKITLDYNHPLAGHDLSFDVNIVDVR